jgi:haloalkane dehalogenase
MVHGNPTWSFFFRKLVLGLGHRYRTVVLDHLGMGLSDRPGEDCSACTLASRTADLEALLDHLSLSNNLTFVLHDWGGLIGLACAVRHPERVARLVLLNTAAFHLPPEKRLPWQLSLVRLPVLGPLLVRGLNAFCRDATRMCVTRGRMPEDVRDTYLAPDGSWRDLLAVLRFVQDIPVRPGDWAYDLVSEVHAGLPCLAGWPIRIFWGMKDFVFDEVILREWLTHFPYAEVTRFADCGHYLLEDAADEIVPLLREFLHPHSLSPGADAPAPDGQHLPNHA